MHPDSSKSGGFFSKVMHLMRSKAGTDIPSDADHLGVLETSQEVRERRRRNEAIRRQEFAQLRAL